MQPFQECEVAFGRNLTEHKHPEPEEWVINDILLNRSNYFKLIKLII